MRCEGLGVCRVSVGAVNTAGGYGAGRCGLPVVFTLLVRSALCGGGVRTGVHPPAGVTGAKFIVLAGVVTACACAGIASVSSAAARADHDHVAGRLYASGCVVRDDAPRDRYGHLKGFGGEGCRCQGEQRSAMGVFVFSNRGLHGKRVTTSFRDIRTRNVTLL